jgi:hypothetical protein
VDQRAEDYSEEIATIVIDALPSSTAPGARRRRHLVL